jgi:23S rRNA maturation-related 3'-5' exoribonuclease YhaM
MNSHVPDNEEASMKEEFIQTQEVKNLIDDIESRVNEIYEKLEPIQGLSEIDEIFALIGKLSQDLY